MSDVLVSAPKSLGTRDLLRAWVEQVPDLPDDLTNISVVIDCSQLQTATPSFFDEFIKILVLERHATHIEFREANERARHLALRSAANRHISDRVTVTTRKERSTWTGLGRQLKERSNWPGLGRQRSKAVP